MVEPIKRAGDFPARKAEINAMRKLVMGLAAMICASDVMAADYLRGSVYEAPPRREPTYYDWEGIYIGGQAGYSNAEFDLTKTAKDAVRNVARFSFLETEGGTRVSDWLDLGRVGASGASYGGFVGYNSQWGEAVLGVELNYSRMGLTGSKTDQLSRSITQDNFRYDVTTAAAVTAKVTDLASLRVRGGYAVGAFMPYLAAGVAAGMTDYSRTASVGYPRPIDMLPPPTPPEQPRARPPSYSDTRGESKTGVFSAGFTLAAGVDVALTRNAFLRFEYEYAALGYPDHVIVDVRTVRSAAAVKF